MIERAAVLGAGSFGTAVAQHVASLPEGRVRDVVLYARDAAVAAAVGERHENPKHLPGVPLSPRLTGSADLERCLVDAELVFLAVPAQHLRGFLREAAGHVPDDAAVVDLAKGIEKAGLKTMSHVIGEELGPRHPMAVLSGPSFAADLARGRPVGLTLASRSRALRDRLQPLLTTTAVDVKKTHDVRGVELGGALKNVFAIAAGMLESLDYGDSLAGDSFTRAMVEMRDIGLRLGGKWSTFSGRSGLGDLVVTCTPSSRNYRFGRAYVETWRAAPEAPPDQRLAAAFDRLGTRTVEGYDTLEAVHEITRRRRMLTPIVEALWRVLYAHEIAPDQLLAAIRELDRSRAREGLSVFSIALHELTPGLWFRRRL